MSDYAETMAREAREALAEDRPTPDRPWMFWAVLGAVLSAFFIDWRVGAGFAVITIYERLSAIHLSIDRQRHEAKLRGIMLDEAINRLKSIQFAVNPESRKSL